MVATENDSDMCKIEFAGKNDFRAIFPTLAGRYKKPDTIGQVRAKRNDDLPIHRQSRGDDDCLWRFAWPES